MKRKHPVVLSVCFALLVGSLVSAKQEPRTINLSKRALNAAPLYGPEGIVIAADGSVYAGNHDGKIKRILSTGAIEPFADLNNLPGQRQEKIAAIGLAMDGEGDIYAATYDFNGGSVLKVTGPGKPDAGKVVLFRHGIGLANFVLIDKETKTMYVSDSSMFSGRVFRFNMKDETLVGKAADPQRDVLAEFSYANGLALGPEKEWLYVAETTKGRISKLYLKTGKSHVFAEVGGWADGLAFDPKNQLLYVCDNKGGRILALNTAAEIVGETRLIGKEGQCAPASLVFRDENTIIFTDLWKASTWAALLRRPQYHSYVYQLSVKEVLK
ncbi:SMP-30/gluconolactonase/LRE family protein [Candidatus Poribacteria bacterium]|nr:SMP-30/gluconolactonase/LRE family protein [Candidatus Poribacteria bacterium]